MACMKEHNLGLENTLGDYIFKSVEDSLLLENVDAYHAAQVAENVTGRGKHDIRKIRESYGTGLQEYINKLGLSSNRIRTINEILRPIKDCWLSFGAKRLEGIVSSLITDPEKATTRLDDLIDFNITVVNDRRLEKPTIYNGFHDPREKFVSHDVEPQIIEGFVHETDRYIVKLTGSFQALNRITGTARYQFGEKFEEE